MEGVGEYVIPVWHPIVVHLPLAALVLAAFAAIVWLVRGDRSWLLTTAYLSIAGAVGAAAAYITGDAVYQQSEGVPVVEALVGSHKSAALATLLVSIVVAALWLAALTRRSSDVRPIPPILRWGMVVLAVAAAILVVRAGHLGGLMTWGAPPQ